MSETITVQGVLCLKQSQCKVFMSETITVQGALCLKQSQCKVLYV